MKKALFAVLACLSAAACWARKTAERPKIYAIANVEILSSDAPAAQSFYSQIIAPGDGCIGCAKNPFYSVSIPNGQFIALSQFSRAARNRLVAVSFDVDDEDKVKKWFAKNNIVSRRLNDSLPGLAVVDPEGHQLFFVDRRNSRRHRTVEGDTPLVKQLIHAGWVVKDREAMDKLYRDVLGFRVYWHGGMKEGETNWVDMQVPDGTDWIEYMLNVPADADKRTLGVMNHIALGVPDVRAAANRLEKAGFKLTEEPKIGRDGKWQLNLYDPDETRVELMEFTPVGKPCCAQYTGPHPKP